MSEYISTNKTFYSALRRAKLDICLANKVKKIQKRDKNIWDIETEQEDDSLRFTKSKKAMLEHYDKILDDTRLSLEETRMI